MLLLQYAAAFVLSTIVGSVACNLACLLSFKYRLFGRASAFSRQFFPEVFFVLGNIIAPAMGAFFTWIGLTALSVGVAIVLGHFILPSLVVAAIIIEALYKRFDRNE